jgi:hypothetical protein
MENDSKKSNVMKLLTSMFVRFGSRYCRSSGHNARAVRIGDLESVVDVFRSPSDVTQEQLFQRG